MTWIAYGSRLFTTLKQRSCGVLLQPKEAMEQVIVNADGYARAAKRARRRAARAELELLEKAADAPTTTPAQRTALAAAAGARAANAAAKRYGSPGTYTLGAVDRY